MVQKKSKYCLSLVPKSVLLVLRAIPLERADHFQGLFGTENFSHVYVHTCRCVC